jgi:hypothetical protein
MQKGQVWSGANKVQDEADAETGPVSRRRTAPTTPANEEGVVGGESERKGLPSPILAGRESERERPPLPSSAAGTAVLLSVLGPPSTGDPAAGTSAEEATRDGPSSGGVTAGAAARDAALLELLRPSPSRDGPAVQGDGGREEPEDSPGLG